MADETHQRYKIDPNMPPFEPDRPLDDAMNNMSVPTFVRLPTMRWAMLSRDGTVNHVVEPYILHPVVLQSMNARSLFEASGRSWPLKIHEGVWDEVEPFADVWVDVTNDDDAQNNGRMYKHEAAVVATLPPNVIKLRKKVRYARGPQLHERRLVKHRLCVTQL